MHVPFRDFAPLPLAPLAAASDPPTPRDVVHREGSARLYRFHRPAGVAAARGAPMLLVPSLINRWHVLDLYPGRSLVGALVASGRETFCLDWGVAGDEDRDLSWDDLLARIRRAIYVVRRETGAPRVGLLGYSVSASMVAIIAALYPERVAALVNVAGPIDFSRAGTMARLTDPRWFDVEAVTAAGNVGPATILAGFLALRPLAVLTDAAALARAAGDPGALAALRAMQRWAYDGVPFPAAAYGTFIREMYQHNRLVRGEHGALGRVVDLRAIRCPVLTVAAERDAICPPAAAAALNDHCGGDDRTLLLVPGGHVSALVGASAPAVLYPSLTAWLGDRRALDA